MPFSSNSTNSAAKRPVAKRPEKPVSSATTKLPANEIKPKSVEKLDLNINSKKASSPTTKKPNIDILNLTKVKDNRQFSSRFKISSYREIQELPSFKDVQASEREALLIEKLRQCSVVFDFSDLMSDIKYKDIKKRALMEISEYFSSNTGVLSDTIYKEVVCMVGANVFRTLPPSCNVSGPDPDGDDEDPFLEASWPHLQHVYEVFLRFVESHEFSANIAKQHIDPNFILYIMELFDCEDPRERDYLKTILHRIYGKMITLRAFIRKQINNIFYRQIYEIESFNGTGELLEILGSIINGFQVPLKEEHRVFLRRVLLPLHKVPSLGLFQAQLAYCVIEFIKKDGNLLSVVIVQGLLKFWPKTQSLKEIMLLNELEECLELSDMEQFQSISKPVFNQISRCICSQHFQVCERALLFWNNDVLHAMFVKNIHIILPATFPALYYAKQHWNKTIHGLVYNALKIMMDINQKLFDECTLKFKEDKQREIEMKKKHHDWWVSVNSIAKKNPLYPKLASELGDDFPIIEAFSENGKKDVESALKDLELETQSNSSDNKKSKKSDTSWKPGSSTKSTKAFKN